MELNIKFKIKKILKTVRDGSLKTILVRTPCVASETFKNNMAVKIKTNKYIKTTT